MRPFFAGKGGSVLKDTIKITQGEVFILNGKKVVLNRSITFNDLSDRGFFILDMWNQCNIPKLDIFPVEYVVVNSYEEQYELFKYNVVMGEAKDV